MEKYFERNNWVVKQFMSGTVRNKDCTHCETTCKSKANSSLLNEFSLIPVDVSKSVMCLESNTMSVDPLLIADC